MTSALTYETWDDQRAQQKINEMGDYLDVIKWAYREYGDQILYACSFGVEGIVLIDLISKVKKDAKIVFLDTGLHFKETYELISKVKAKYPSLNIQMVEPELSLKEQAHQYGEKLWERNPNLCCEMRKVIPLTEQLSHVKAWISGLRREQSETRSHLNYINRDDKFKVVKVCPLIHWTWDDIWNYVHLNQLPYNELHDQNYPSIGCEKCTLPVEKATGSRDGRWANSTKTECGLHQV